MTPPTAAPELPDALLARILQHVPQQQRLSACALVCKAWAAAAAAASDSISLDLSKAADTDVVLPSFEAWLQQHGSNLDSLEVERPHGSSKIELPCAALVQLTSLCLGRLEVHAGLMSEQQQGARHSSTPALPRLLDLTLYSCKLGSPATLQLLAASPDLTTLDLQRVWWEAEPSQQQPQVTDAPSPALSAVLQACSRLQCLGLCFRDSAQHSACMPLSSLSALSGLLQLQDLTLSDLYPTSSTAGIWPALPTSLTGLYLDGGQPQLPDQAGNLTHLQALELEKVSFAPRMLFGMTQLQRLKLCLDEHGGGLLPAAADTRRPFATLLAAIARLTQLHLVVWQDAELNAAGVQPQAFAGFTASSQLQTLHAELSLSTPGRVPCRDVLQHMFPDGRRLEQLQSLALGAVDDVWSWHVPGADLARIAASCPSLHTLSISHLLEQGADLTPLLQFTACKSLTLSGWAFDDRAALLVAQLTQLTSLEWDCTPQEYPDDSILSETGVMQLTALSHLQQLKLQGAKVWDERGNVVETKIEQALGRPLPLLLTPSAQDGPVWLQMHRLLGASEPVLDFLQKRQQQSLADLQELQQLRRRTADLERLVLQAQALGFRPGEGDNSAPGAQG